MPDYIFGLGYETKLFLFSFVIGALFGATFDILRIIRIVKRHNNAVIFIEDFLFVLFCGFWYFIFSTDMARGQIRLFTLIGIIIGFGVYLLTVGSLTKRLAFGIKLVYDRIEKLLRNKIFIPIYTNFKSKFVQNYISFIKRRKSRKKGLKVNKNVVYNDDK